MDPEKLLTNSLRTNPQGEKICRILAAALEAVDPAQAVKRFVSYQGTHLSIGDLSYDLKNIERVLVAGFGKASLAMGQALVEVLAGRISAGILIPKSLPPSFSFPHPQFTIIQGTHPVPDERSIAGAHSMIDLLSGVNENDLVIFLISGGGSSLLTSPVPDISLGEIQDLNKKLLACGATIHEINVLRKHLSQVKGGQLARLVSPAQVIALILSDVVGDPIDTIASGPTVWDPSTYEDALSLLEKYKITTSVSPSIPAYLRRGMHGDVPETPKRGDPIFNRVQNLIIASNLQAAQAAVEKAKMEGFNTSLLTTAMQGEAREIGKILAAIAKQSRTTGDPIPSPACIICGGETTVTLQGAGIGGRNQELALAAVTGLAGLRDSMLVTLATDGEDGPTDAAGAVVTGVTLERARSINFHPEEYLAQNDSYSFFKPLGDLLKPGLTGTNVCDLALIFVF